METKINRFNKMSDNEKTTSSSSKISLKITDLRSELNKSYTLFTKVRDTLANLSFTKFETPLPNDLCEFKFNINEMAKKENFDKTMNMFSEGVNENIKDSLKAVDNVPELREFLNAINDLKNGIRSMDETNDRFVNLDLEINREIDRVTKKTEDIQGELDKVDGEMVRQAIKIFEVENKMKNVK